MRIRGSGYWNVVARLKPDTSIAQARRELDVLSAQLAQDYPNSNKNTVAEVIPIRDHLAGSVRSLCPAARAAGLLLLVACANVANLLLARGASRGREFAMRQALGAGRGRLVRQMLAESLLLATAGGVLGLLVAKWGLQIIASLSPLDVPGPIASCSTARRAPSRSGSRCSPRRSPAWRRRCSSRGRTR